MRPWYFRFARPLIFGGAGIVAIAIAIIAATDTHDVGRGLVEARQLYGLWALGLLLASMLIGPLTSVVPWLPVKPPLMYARRAVGVSTLGFALLHVAAYLVSVVLRTWRELYTPGILWVIGLVLGLLGLIDMLALGITSRDAAVKRMGGRKWKSLHKTVYIALGIVLLHALFVGADFGLNRSPDVTGEADFGSLIAFSCVTATWMVLTIARRRGWRWIKLLKPDVTHDR